MSPSTSSSPTGLFGSKVSFAPLRGASADGDVLRIPFEKAQVKDAPRVDPDGHLEAEEEEALFRHYAVEGRSQAQISRSAGAGHDTSGPNTDDAMTRSEEEHEVVLHEERPVVGTETVPKERVRISKDTVLGEEQVGGDVRKEQIGIDRDPDT